MTNTQHIAQEDLVLYAMQGLSAEEASAIAAHLATCSQCSQEVAEFRGDLALLALSVEQHPVPAEAEQRFMARLAAEPKHVAGAAGANVLPFADAPAQQSTQRAATKRTVWPVLVPWAAAAALAVACVSLGVENKKLSETVSAEAALNSDLSSKGSRAQLVVDALNSPHAQRVTLTSTKQPPEPTGHAIYLADRGSLLFQADNLKPLEADKTYELWVIPADGKAPLPAGTFRPDAAGYASVVLPQLPAGVAAKAFGVTIEKLGGATSPTMPIVLAGAPS